MAVELIRLDTTIKGIDSLIAKAKTVEGANELFKAKDVVYSQIRYYIDVKGGKWIEIAGYGGWGDTYYQCPECKTTEYVPSNFCPNCGAELREIENG